MCKNLTPMYPILFLFTMIQQFFLLLKNKEEVKNAVHTSSLPFPENIDLSLSSSSLSLCNFLSVISYMKTPFLQNKST